ncbi:hypothetical protein [Flavobacterium sp. I3-2]|uniref:hypothetical protein n=1 Tax=Flavobacterium sp. I3-2 TaxID=2748319 RepID=UPI0015B1EF2D|nr:hypothetical protein [Flavobacterium sp. I3-2]
MNKIILILLSLSTLIIIFLLLKNHINIILIPTKESFKSINIHHAKIEEIKERIDISECEKEKLIQEVEINREHDQKLSQIAGKTIAIGLALFIIQFVIFIMLFFIPKK